MVLSPWGLFSLWLVIEDRQQMAVMMLWLPWNILLLVRWSFYGYEK